MKMIIIVLELVTGRKAINVLFLSSVSVTSSIHHNVSCFGSCSYMNSISTGFINWGRQLPGDGATYVAAWAAKQLYAICW
jgi:hypothetical protein